MARKGGENRGIYTRRLADGRFVHYVRLWHEGRRQQFGSFPSKSEARTFYQNAKREQKERQFFPDRYRQGGSGELFADVLKRYLALAAHKKTYKEDLQFAAWWNAWFHQARVTAILPAGIEAARITLLKTGRLGRRSPARVNRYVTWLSHILQLEHDYGHIHRNPCRPIKRFKERKPPEVQWTLEQERRLRKELGDKASWMRLAILTGLRQGEQFGLKREWVDLKNRTIHLPDPKSGEPQVLYLNQEAVDILRDISRAISRDTVWVFPRKRDPSRPISGKLFYQDYFTPACVRAGTDWIGRKA